MTSPGGIFIDGNAAQQVRDQFANRDNSIPAPYPLGLGIGGGVMVFAVPAHLFNECSPGKLLGPTAAAAQRPFLRICVNGVPGGGAYLPFITAPKVRNAATLHERN